MGKIIALILAVVIGIGVGIGSCAFWGRGNGNGSGVGSGDSVPTSESISDSSEENHVSEIRIDKDKIYFDNELCADENELKQRITDIGTEREYIFVQDHAIKGTYDKVDAVLSELESALGITINGK